MKTLLINTDSSSAKLFLALARKLHMKARVLSIAQKEDAALFALMEERKNDKTVSVSEVYAVLRKVK